MQVSLILEKIQMPPTAFKAVVYRLLKRLAGRASESPTDVLDVKINAALRMLKSNIDHLPRRLKAKRTRKQICKHVATCENRYSSSSLRLTRPLLGPFCVRLCGSEYRVQQVNLHRKSKRASDFVLDFDL